MDSLKGRKAAVLATVGMVYKWGSGNILVLSFPEGIGGVAVWCTHWKLSEAKKIAF